MKRNGKNIRCQFCKESFYVPKYRLNTARYCSRSCCKKDNPVNQLTIKRNYGKNHHNYKGGFLNDAGYKVICVKGQRCYEHRYLMEKLLKRKLNFSETIHHINGNRSDNKLENLEIVDRSKHTSIYHPHPKIIKKINLICEFCKKTYFKARRRKTRRFCSNKCKNFWLSQYWKTNNPKHR